MIAGLLAAFIALPAAAVHPASPDAVKKIEGWFLEAKAITAVIADKERKFRSSAGPVLPPDFSQRLEAELKEDRELREEVMQKAARLTLTAYGLTPPDGKGNPVMPVGEIASPILKQYGMEGQVTWKLIYRDPPPLKRIVAPGFRGILRRKPDLEATISVTEAATYDGATSAEGTTFIWPQFTDPKTQKPLTAPAFARLLHHEMRHFRLKTDPKTASMGANREEDAVYKADQMVLDRFGFSPEELEIQGKFLFQMRADAKSRFSFDDVQLKIIGFSRKVAGFVRGGHRTDAANIETSIPGFFISAQDMNKIRERADEVEIRVARQAEERRFAPQGDSPGPSDSVSSPPSRPSSIVVPILPRSAVAAQLPPPAVAATLPVDLWAQLNGLAARGCAESLQVTQADIDAIWPRLQGLPYSPQRATGYGLEGCQANLFLRLLKMAADRDPSRLTVDIFQMTAAASAPAVPSSDFIEEHPGRGSDSPSVPTCRYHPWCRDWNP